jgi:hypothetical protein
MSEPSAGEHWQTRQPRASLNEHSTKVMQRMFAVSGHTPAPAASFAVAQALISNAKINERIA